MLLTILMIATTVAAWAGGRLTAHLTARRAVRQLRAQLADAAQQLTHDPLTGLLNRAGLLAAHTTMATTTRSIAAMLIDLDDFKTINDQYGHDTGDHLLTTVAQRLDELATAHDGVAGRLAGDEFVLRLPSGDRDLSRIAQTCAHLIAEPVHVNLDGALVTLTCTASIGVAIAAGGDGLADVVLHRADIAMYRAKTAGGNRHVIHQPGMTMPAGGARRGPRRRDRRHHRGGVNT